jgi:hypothetical protein
MEPFPLELTNHHGMVYLTPYDHRLTRLCLVLFILHWVRYRNHLDSISRRISSSEQSLLNLSISSTGQSQRTDS